MHIEFLCAYTWFLLFNFFLRSFTLWISTRQSREPEINLITVERSVDKPLVKHWIKVLVCTHNPNNNRQ